MLPFFYLYTRTLPDKTYLIHFVRRGVDINTLRLSRERRWRQESTHQRLTICPLVLPQM